jgi:hypothetical protein
MAAETVAAGTAIAATDTAPPVDVAQANPFSDVPENSWAYDAVRQLAAAGLVTGYPDNTFKGNRPMTRYEMAVLINRAVNAIQSKIAQGGSGTVKASDLDAIKKLVDGFRAELNQVQAAIRALQAQTAALKTQGDAATAAANAARAQSDALRKQLSDDEAVLRATAATVTAGSIHPKMWDRANTYNQSVTVGAAGYGFTYGAANAAGVIANPATITYGTLGGQVALQTAQIGRSTNFSVARVDFTGAPDPRIQWGVRLEQVQKWSGSINGSGALTGVAPAFCTSNLGLACSTQDGGNSAGGTFPVRLAYDYIGYFSPGGFFAKIGRISQDEGRQNGGLELGGAQVNGVQVGYKDKNWYGYIFPNEQSSANFNIANYTTAVSAASGLAAGVPLIGQCPYGYPGNTAAANAATNIPVAAGPGGSAGFMPTVNGNNCITQGTGGVAGMLEYYNIPSRTAVGFAFDWYNTQNATGWNPYAGLCVGAGPSLSVGATAVPTTTPGAGTSTWNTAVTGRNGYCVQGQPLVQPAGTANAGFPVTGAYQSIPMPIKTDSMYIVQYLGNSAVPQFRLTAEYQGRIGNDPFTAANPASPVATAWGGNKSLYLEASFASKGNWAGGPLFPGAGLRNSNVIQYVYYNQGFNATGLDDGVTGTGSFESAQQYLGNYAGFKWNMLHVSHWFTNNLRAGFDYYVLQNAFNVPAGSSACPGCNVGSYIMHSLGVDIFLSL